MSEIPTPNPLAVEALAWNCDPASLPFKTTKEVDSASGILGQSSATTRPKIERRSGEKERFSWSTKANYFGIRTRQSVLRPNTRNKEVNRVGYKKTLAPRSDFVNFPG